LKGAHIASFVVGHNLRDGNAGTERRAPLPQFTVEHLRQHVVGKTRIGADITGADRAVCMEIGGGAQIERLW